jgi:hypothetical protein
MVLVHDKSLRAVTKEANLRDLIGAKWTVEKVATSSPYTLFSVRSDQPVLSATDKQQEPATAEASQPVRAEQQSQTSHRSPFRHPGKHGIGAGWRPTRMDFLDNMRRQDGTLVIDARADATSIACGPDIPIDGAAHVTGRLRADGLNHKGFAEVTLTFRDADDAPIRDARGKVVIHRIERVTGTTDWSMASDSAVVPGARFARACVWVRGNTGRAWADAIEVQSGETPERNAERDGVADADGSRDTGP